MVNQGMQSKGPFNPPLVKGDKGDLKVKTALLPKMF